MRVHSVVLPLLPAAALCRAAPEGASAATQEEPPPRGSVRIRDVQTSGSGCPPGSVSTQISQDLTTVTIGMTKMAAYYGPDYRSSENLRNCEIHVDLSYPGGYQFSVMTATYNGYARLDPGVIGQLTSSYFFSQSPTRIKYTRTQIDGPQYEMGFPFQKTDTANDKTTIFSPCGNNGILNVNDIVSISSRNRQLAGELNVFDATIRFTQQVYIQWRRCASESASGGSSTGGRPPSGMSPTAPKTVPKAPTAPKSSGQRPGRGGRGGGSTARGQSWYDEEDYGFDDQEYRDNTQPWIPPPPQPVPPRQPPPTTGTETFGPIIYTGDIGDLRKVREHELTDFKTTLTNPPREGDGQ